MNPHVRIPPLSEPEPDLALLRWRDDFYPDLPEPSDVLLAVEVGDSSARCDRWRKVPLYAGAGIPQTWLVDVSAGVIEDHRQPAGAAYGAVSRLQPGSLVSVEAVPDIALEVASLLGGPIG
ncbi:MAG: Uma2 family endonuclease [Acidimicrobiales bacterium]